MSLILTVSSKLPVIKVGRVAGQFSKPRSAPVEVKDGKELPSYLGDNINSMDFTKDGREPARKIIKSLLSICRDFKFVACIFSGGFADLNKVHYWNMSFVNETAQKNIKKLQKKLVTP